jgi:UDP-MurNAc hydroxylase
MEVHMIGHASIFVKTEDCSILMDPVLWDPHQQGLCHICPQREIEPEGLPDCDVLIISHRHSDHFDIQSLAFLPKTLEVIIPKDPLIAHCLRRLGYTKIHPTEDLREVKIGSTTICTTPSQNRVPEFGVLFADPSGLFWNQVDTVVDVDSSLLRYISQYGKVDFLLATWQQMIEMGYQQNQPLSFPFQDYQRLLTNINKVQPGAVAPGANGFKYVGNASWLNQIVFPITRERFCEDVKLACPALAGKIFALDPGDVVSISDHHCSYAPQAASYVKTVRDDREELDFEPVLIGADLVDHNPYNLRRETLESTVYEAIEALPAFINERPQAFAEHHRWKLIYQLEIVFPDERRKYCLDFGADTVRISEGRNPLVNYFVFITGSSIVGFLEGKTDWDYVMLGGSYRRFNKVYAVTPLGILRPKPNLFPDILELKFPHQHVLREFLEREIHEWSSFYIASAAGR